MSQNKSMLHASVSKINAAEALIDNSASQAAQRNVRRGFVGTQSYLDTALRHPGGAPGGGEDEQNQIFIQGTMVNISKIAARIREFLLTFSPRGEAAADAGEADEKAGSFYLRELHHIFMSERYSLLVDAQHVYEFSRELYFQLVYYPGEVISVFDQEAAEVFKERFLREPEQRLAFDKAILTTVTNLREKSHIRGISFDRINSLVSIQGIVIRVSDVYPEMKTAVFRCLLCRHAAEAPIRQGRIEEPPACAACQKRNTLELQHNLCVFSDKQFVKVQEAASATLESGVPATATLVVYDDLVDAVRPGEAVEVVGIFRAQAHR